MNKTKKISDFTFVIIFISAITFSALLISTSDQKGKFMSEKFDACKEDPYSHKCGISYNPTDEQSWFFSTFWIELRDVVVWWDRNSKRELGMNNRAYPLELSEIMSSPAFTVENNEKEYDCYVLPLASMTVYFRNFGYPQPFSAVENGEENFIVWPDIHWFCSPKGSDHSLGWKPWEDLGLEVGEYFLGQGPPYLRIENEEGQWYMWGPTLPEGYGGNDKPKEFPIVNFNWIYGEGINFPKLCNEIKYTYQEDFERNCR